MAASIEVLRKHGFQPGQSGNPGGRPKGLIEFRKRLEALDGMAEAALESCLSDPDPKVRVAALKEFFDRRYGKAPQAITGENGNPLRLEVGASIVDTLRRMAAYNDEPAK